MTDHAIETHSSAGTIPALCRGDGKLLEHWLERRPLASVAFCVPAIFLGCGAYGFTMGLWKGWEMASYVGIKFPLVIFATLILNGLLNGMLALALGSGIGFRQSVQFLLTGFALMAIILAALSPITFGMALQAPSPDAVDRETARHYHSVILLVHTAVIAFAGVVSHRTLLRHVREFAASAVLGTRTFFAWLAGNLFVGAQVSWIMRPFFGSPGLDVQFLRDDPLNGSFYDTVLQSFLTILGG
ncbi:MAG: hypothetical protein ACPG32_07810 [Akkermansiaceae bacterium]